MGHQIQLLDVSAPVPPPRSPSLDLPERVRMIGMWWKWGAAVAACADGHPRAKWIETRDWLWPYPSEAYPSSWLVIHASLRADGPVPGRVEPFPEFPPVEPGALCALVRVVRCRLLLPADRDRALRYHPDVFAWELDSVRRLKPVKMRGPQKFGSVPRAVVLDALTEKI